jgi:hypothetical protein
MVDFNCCPHMAELRAVLAEVQLERVRSEIDNGRLQQEVERLKAENESLTAIIEHELILNRSHSPNMEKDFQFD